MITVIHVHMFLDAMCGLDDEGCHISQGVQSVSELGIQPDVAMCIYTILFNVTSHNIG